MSFCTFYIYYKNIDNRIAFALFFINSNCFNNINVLGSFKFTISYNQMFLV